MSLHSDILGGGKFPQIWHVSKKTVSPQSPSSTFVYSRDSLVPLLTTMEWTYVPYIQSQHWQHKSPQPLSHCDTSWRIKSVHRYRNSAGKWYSPCSFFFHINRVPIFGRKKSLWRNQKWRSEYWWRTRPGHLRPPDWFLGFWSETATAMWGILIAAWLHIRRGSKNSSYGESLSGYQTWVT